MGQTKVKGEGAGPGWLLILVTHNPHSAPTPRKRFPWKACFKAEYSHNNKNYFKITYFV